jgi:hypothetical protein
MSSNDEEGDQVTKEQVLKQIVQSEKTRAWYMGMMTGLLVVLAMIQDCRTVEDIGDDQDTCEKLMRSERWPSTYPVHWSDDSRC